MCPSELYIDLGPLDLRFSRRKICLEITLGAHNTRRNSIRDCVHQHRHQVHALAAVRVPVPVPLAAPAPTPMPMPMPVRTPTTTAAFFFFVVNVTVAMNVVLVPMTFPATSASSTPIANGGGTVFPMVPPLLHLDLCFRPPARPPSVPVTTTGVPVPMPVGVGVGVSIRVAVAAGVVGGAPRPVLPDTVSTTAVAATTTTAARRRR